MRLSILKKHIMGLKLKAKHLHTITPQICLSSKHVMIDEKIQICGHGLQPGQKVTLQAFMEESGREYGSCGHYIADHQGAFNTFKDPSKSGTYAGIEPMGLFWSMKTRPGQKPRRLTKADIMSPYSVTLALHEGFRDFENLPWENIEKKCTVSTKLLRYYTKNGVKRVPVEYNGIYGTFFFPPGEGPFPAVIDMFGITSEILEFRSALLASHGIASFTITYTGRENLPKSMAEFDFNYFLKSYDYMISHPMIDADRTGGIATCGGAGFLLLIAYKRPRMKCFVTVNGALGPAGLDQIVEGELIKGLNFKMENSTCTDDGVIMRDMYESSAISTVPPGWQNGAKAMFIQGLDDNCVHPNFLKEFLESVPEKYHKNITVLTYPGTGHLLEPPYTPHTPSNFNPFFGTYLLWGGNTKQHAAAQEDSWPKIISFLQRYLYQI